LFFIPLMYFAKDLVPEKLYKRTETIQSYEEDTSAMQRIRAWHVAWNIALDRPLTGAGFEFESSPVHHDRWWSYVPESYIGLYGEKAHVAHSIYFQMLGQHGFIGLGLFLALLVSVLRTLRAIQKDARANPDLNWMGDYAAAIRIAIFGYAVSGAFLNVAFFDLLYLFVGITAVLHKELAASQATPATSEQTTSLSRRTRLQIQGESPRLAEKSVN
jgi:putative inorganic carbon (hco3(-)) transporter